MAAAWACERRRAGSIGFRRGGERRIPVTSIRRGVWRCAGSCIGCRMGAVFDIRCSTFNAECRTPNAERGPPPTTDNGRPAAHPFDPRTSRC
ncbi:hypothetical protein EXY28_21900 [Burkholderia pseudomallei]|nr:hypothetical protein EXY28_21900 [Burkholderia pseudomallei]QBP66633.1 hypothetical protein E2R29_21625 [Burkholderia pseudomallei]